MAFLAYLEEDEVMVGGKGGWRCGTSASAAVAICAFTKCIFISITGLHGEHTDVKDYINRARNALLFLHQPEAERVKTVACCIRL